MNRLLRITRIIISAAVLAILTAALCCSALTLPVVGPWLMHLQIVPSIAGMTIFVFILWLLITLFFGRIYCSSICPLGTLQDVAARTVRLGRNASKRRYTYTAPSPRLRYSLMALMAIALMAGITAITSVLDPYSAFSRICTGFFTPEIEFIGSVLHAIGINMPGSDRVVASSVTASIIATLIFAIVAGVAAHGGRTICNTVCPVGTMLGLVSRYSIFQIDIDTDKCIQCGRCRDVCKGRCINLTDHVVDGSRCVDCFNCINVCPNDAIHFTTSRKRLAMPMMQPIDASAAAIDKPTVSTPANQSASK